MRCWISAMSRRRLLRISKAFRARPCRARLYRRERRPSHRAGVSAHAGDDPRVRGCATWHTLIVAPQRDPWPDRRSRPSPGGPHAWGNTKGCCPFVPEGKSTAPCGPPSAAPDALRGVGRARAACPHQAIDFPPPSPSRSSPERQSRMPQSKRLSAPKEGEEGQWLTHDTRAIPTGSGPR